MSLVSKHKISRKKATVMANLQVHPWTNLKAGGAIKGPTYRVDLL